MKKSELTYQEALAELESIVNQLEEEDIVIDNLAELVKRASFLVETCRAKLKSTEQNLKETLG